MVEEGALAPVSRPQQLAYQRHATVVEEAEASVHTMTPGLQLGGPGCSWVSEFDTHDLACVLGRSPDSCATYVGNALELRHRLPRLWDRVVASEVPTWKAFRLAEQTQQLPPAGAADVDRALAPTAHSGTFAQVDRTVAAAQALAQQVAATDHRPHRRPRVWRPHAVKAPGRAARPPRPPLRVPVLQPPPHRPRPHPRLRRRWPDKVVQPRARLCRAHHRAKTHSPWAYTQPRPGVFEWHSPVGATYVVDRSAEP